MINKDLKKYIETNVLPIYSKNEQGHGPKHIEYVVRRSLKFADQVPNVNYDMVYTVTYRIHQHCQNPNSQNRLN